MTADLELPMPPGWRAVTELRSGRALLHLWSPPTPRRPHGAPVTFTAASLGAAIDIARTYLLRIETTP